MIVFQAQVVSDNTLDLTRAMLYRLGIEVATPIENPGQYVVVIDNKKLREVCGLLGWKFPEGP